MKTTLHLLAFLLLFTGTLRAQVPQFLNYQGRVAVNGVNFDGSGLFKFALVDAAGTTTFWSNDGTSTGGAEPTAAVAIPVSKGLYSVLLGDTSLGNMTPVFAGYFLNPDLRLRVWFNDGSNGSQQITPDQRIASVGYAMRAASAEAAAYAGSAGTVYGDQSAGNFTAPPGETTLEVSNPQFVHFTVPQGRTLHIASGTTIRCRGTFTNDGTIIVDPAGGATNSAEILDVNRGIARTSPSGDVYANSYKRGGKAYPRSQLKTMFSIGLEGGGTGSPGYNNLPSVFALGGGALRVLAQGQLSNSGTVRAMGQNGASPISVSGSPQRAGGGGGGGGVVILASASSLIQDGVLDVSGGTGGADVILYTNGKSMGPGGGGGGGFIRLLAPAIVSTGQNVVLAGATSPRLPAAEQIFYGGAGGASAGDGAGYPDVITNLNFEAALDGLVVIDVCNPTALLGN